MNERINELNREAQAFAIRIWGDDEDYFNQWVETYKEKLAELIVQECVKVAHPKLTDVGEWAAGMRLVQQRLKQHFGVEE